MSPILCNKGHENPTGSLFCQTCGEKLSPPPAKLMLSVGEVLEGRYRIAQQIGQGGFGRTYLCENLNRFNEPCVLKEFAPQVQGIYALNKAKTLFEREANVLHQLTHDQIPRFRELFQVNSGGGGLFLVQDYVAGQTYRYLLGQRMIKNETFSAAEVHKFLLDVLPVLEYIHSLGVIHRDIAPDNLILRSSDNLPVLIDFGGVKQLAVNAEIQAIGGTDLPTCLGKVGYAPHEQLQRGQTYPHSDLYALAATALVLATGKEPTSLTDPQNLQWNWRNYVTLDPQFGEVLDRMLHPNTIARFQSATAAITALQAINMTRGLPSSNTVGTVVLAPGGSQPQGSPQRSAGPVTVPGGDPGELWPILKRSWLALAGVAVLGSGGWAAYRAFSGSTTISTPVTSPSVVESPASSAAATPSPVASDRSSETRPAASIGSNDNSGNEGSNRRTTSQTKANSDRPPRRSPKSEVATSSRNRQPTAPTQPKSETVEEGDNRPPATSRSPEDIPPATPQRSRSSSNRQPPSSELDNEPSSEPRRPSSASGESSAPSRSRSSSEESSAPSRSRSSSSESSAPSRSRSSSEESSAPSRPRRSTEAADNGGASQRTARESNSNRPHSSNSAPRSAGSSGASSTKPSEEPLF